MKRDRVAGRVEAIERWFAANARDLPWRADYEPWHVWVSEVMLQQTRMDVVLRYFPRFIARFPSPAVLAAADEDEVVALWSGLGYYRRARMLRAGAQAVIAGHGGVVPGDHAALRRLPGVGEYTAGSIASIAFNLREAVVDGNVQRLIARLDTLDGAWGSGELRREAWRTSREMVASAESPRNFNQGMMELGARVCSPGVPRCGECPLTALCGAYASGDPAQWPRPAIRPSQKRVDVPLLVILDDAGRVLLLRCAGPLMGGMFHLPHGSGELLPDVDLSTVLRRERFLGTIRHSITHRAVTFSIYEAVAAGESLQDGADAIWLDPRELGSVPHPSYVRKALVVAGLLTLA